MQKLSQNVTSELPFSLTSMPVGRLVKHKHGVLYLQERRGEMHALTHRLHGLQRHNRQTGRGDQGRSSLSPGTTDASHLLPFALSQLFP